jgi:hypothetical protein
MKERARELGWDIGPSGGKVAGLNSQCLFPLTVNVYSHLLPRYRSILY